MVTQPLEYSSLTHTEGFTLRRLFLWGLYYVCWWLALVVPGTAGVGFLYETFRPQGIDDDLILFVGPGVGAAAGCVLGYLLRRRRWLQVGPMLLGAATLAFGAVMTHAALNEPQGFLWEVVVLFYTAVALSGLALCIAGASGWVLNRRPRRLSFPFPR